MPPHTAIAVRSMKMRIPTQRDRKVDDAEQLPPAWLGTAPSLASARSSENTAMPSAASGT